VAFTAKHTKTQAGRAGQVEHKNQKIWFRFYLVSKLIAPLFATIVSLSALSTYIAHIFLLAMELLFSIILIKNIDLCSYANGIFWLVFVRSVL